VTSSAINSCIPLQAPVARGVAGAMINNKQLVYC